VALSASVADEAGLEIERSLDGALDLSAEQELVIYRVAQEGLTNVARHAQASRVELLLRAGENDVTLIVRDDGNGLPADAEADRTGIRGMRERALMIGGDLVIRRVRPCGTELRLRLPTQRRE